MDLEHFPTSPAAKRMLASVSEEFYAKSYVAKWLYQVMGLEWDQVREVIDSMPEQAFVETATWGLMYHEIKWGLPIRENLDYETRRRLIYEKRDVRKPMNPWAMEQLIFHITGRSASVTDSNDDPNIPVNTLVMEINGAETEIDFGAALRKIREVKQSHVSFTLFIRTEINIRISTPTYHYLFPYRMAGEYPDINTTGDIESIGVAIVPNALHYPFDYPAAGLYYAGTVPDTNTAGMEHSGAIAPTAAGMQFSICYPLCGEDYDD